MTADEALAEIARRAGSRLTEADLYYPDAAERFTQRVRLRLRSYMVEVFAGTTHLYIDVHAGVRPPFSVNRPSSLIATDRPIDIGLNAYVFASDACLHAVTTSVQHADIRAAIASIGLQGDEQLVMAENRTLALLIPATPDREWARVNAILRLTELCQGDAAPLTNQPTMRVEDPGLGLQSEYVAWLAKWAISDDDERREAVLNASQEDVADLAQFVVEHGDALNDLLRDPNVLTGEQRATWDAIYQTAAEAAPRPLD